jgi:hypothetical protein
VDYLDASVFINGPCTIGNLVKQLYSKRGSIWVAPTKKISSGHIHALILQLWSANLLDIRLTSESLKNQDDKIKKSDIMCRWSVGEVNDVLRMCHLLL